MQIASGIIHVQWRPLASLSFNVNLLALTKGQFSILMNLFMILWNLNGFRFAKFPNFTSQERLSAFLPIDFQWKARGYDKSLVYSIKQTRPSWCRCQDLNPDYFGGKRILSPLHHPNPLEQDYAIASSCNESYCTLIHV